MGEAAAAGLCRCVGCHVSHGTTGWDMVVRLNFLLLFDLKTYLSLWDECFRESSSRFNLYDRKCAQHWFSSWLLSFRNIPGISMSLSV